MCVGKPLDEPKNQENKFRKFKILVIINRSCAIAVFITMGHVFLLPRLKQERLFLHILTFFGKYEDCVSAVFTMWKFLFSLLNDLLLNTFSWKLAWICRHAALSQAVVIINQTKTKVSITWLNYHLSSFYRKYLKMPRSVLQLPPFETSRAVLKNKVIALKR
jgi:hypothetical protein